MAHTSKAQLDGDLSVLVIRRFAAPRALIWHSFTEPDLLQKWLLGPPGWEMHVCEMDLQTGGGYRWRWRNADTAEEFGFSGTYLAVEPMERIDDRQSFDQGPDAIPMGEPTKNAVTFEDHEGGTQVITRVSYSNTEARDMVMEQGMAAGMEASYARLDALIPTLLEQAQQKNAPQAMRGDFRHMGRSAGR